MRFKSQESLHFFFYILPVDFWKIYEMSTRMTSRTKEVGQNDCLHTKAEHPLPMSNHHQKQSQLLKTTQYTSAL